MKKLITALAMTVLLTACGNEEVATTEQPTTEPVEVKSAATEKPMKSKEAVKVEILEKEMTNSDIQELISLKFRLENDSGKELAGVKGTLVFFDKFNDEVIKFDFSEDALDMPVKGWSEFWLDFPYNQYISNDVKFMAADLEDMTYEFRYHTILFADGTTL
jgi:uncharacterized lipoprotein YehR (DUF1307 family)